MKDYLHEFETTWNRFEVNFKGKVLANMKTQKMTLPFANMLLKDVSSCWLSPYDVCGRWFDEYSKEYPEKAKNIYDILKNDLKFNSEIVPKEVPHYVKYAAPVAAAFIGGGVAHMLSAKFLATVVSAIVPGAVAFSVVNGIEKNTSEQSRNDIIDGYIAQLNIFKTTIENIIKN